MSLPEAFEDKKGFTLIELLIVIAIITVIAGTTIPIGSNFLIRNQFHNKRNEVISSLRQARINSMAGKENSSWGVNIDSQNITFFKGSSYASRDTAFDQTYSIPSNVNITQTEVVFGLATGNPDASKTINISNNLNNSNTIEINAVGVVNVQ